MKNGLETRQSQMISVLSSIITWVVCWNLLWLAKTVLKEAGVIPVWFSHVPWKEECAYADKKNIQKYTTEKLGRFYPLRSVWILKWNLDSRRQRDPGTKNNGETQIRFDVYLFVQPRSTGENKP